MSDATNDAPDPKQATANSNIYGTKADEESGFIHCVAFRA